MALTVEEMEKLNSAVERCTHTAQVTEQILAQIQNYMNSGEDIDTAIELLKRDYIATNNSNGFSRPDGTTIISDDGVLTANIPTVETIVQSIEKEDLGLENVDNTPDNEKHVDKADKDGDGNVITETYATKTEITELKNGLYEVVAVLPSKGEVGVVYLVPLTTGIESDNKYKEYVYVNNAWEQIGTKEIDLSAYSTKEETIKSFVVSTTTTGVQVEFTYADDHTGTFDIVIPQASDTLPVVAGTAKAGTSTKYAREDHIHPLQTTITGNSATSTALATARKLGVNLASTTAVTFDGSADQTNIPVSGTLKIANGGTGLTASPSMLTNLGSTAAANVLTATPRPGVTGTLGVANGGTGQTSIANIQAGKDGAGNTITTTYAKIMLL